MNNPYSDSPTGFLSVINNGTSENPTAPANATHTGPFPTHTDSSPVIKAPARSASFPRAGLSKETK